MNKCLNYVKYFFTTKKIANNGLSTNLRLIANFGVDYFVLLEVYFKFKTRVTILLN